MTHTPEQIKFMLDDMKKNNYHVYKLLTELLEETGRTYDEKPVLREPPEGPPCREFHSFWHKKVNVKLLSGENFRRIMDIKED